MKNLVICITALLVQHSMCRNKAAAQPSLCEQFSESIDPCICEDSILDCSRVSTGSELLAIPGLHTGQSLDFEEIRITGSSIEDIPDGAFGNHYSTGTYMISNNRHLTSIGKSVFLAPDETNTAKYMIVESNPSLESFPFDDVRAFTSLIVLGLARNNLKEIPEAAFEGLGALSELLLYNNHIEYIGANAFSGLPSLANLIANDNNLTSLTPDWFNFAVSPGYVVLANNFIEAIEGDFTNFPAMTILVGNRIETLEQEIWEPVFANFDESEGIDEVLRLAGNPFICNCDMKWLHDNRALEQYTADIQCSNAPQPQNGFWTLEESFFADC